jgi:hypothetical protein
MLMAVDALSVTFVLVLHPFTSVIVTAYSPAVKPLMSSLAKVDPPGPAHA